ncbi:MAG: YicC family protein [Termitinemataceae bacterium]|nr:MAG: YicC family protein [Termitinemataceae bacterium]
MKSMTGFAFIKKEINDLPNNRTQICIEIKSYNNRYLEIFCNLPSTLSALEPHIRSIINSKCERGKIEVNIRFISNTNNIAISVNEQVLHAYIDAAKIIQKKLQDEFSTNNGISSVVDDISVNTFLNLTGVLETQKVDIDENAAWLLIEDPFNDALNKFEEERLREGTHTKENILYNLKILENSLDHIKTFLPAIENSIKENLISRCHEILIDKIDETRILSEVAVMLMKYTIAEEISRLTAHFSEFNAEIINNDKPAKKLDFLCQEINREINTIGSKTPLIEVSKEVVTMKDAAENIREQLRNVE